jgi:surfeit locus 1 family protein
MAGVGPKTAVSGWPWEPRPPASYPDGVPRPSSSGEPAPDYRWALRPWWLVSHVFVLVCVLVFVRLGFWQLARLHERRANNDLITSRQDGPAVPVGTVLRLDSRPDEVDGQVYRTVSATGRWRPDEQVLIRNRTYDGAPGFEVVTPLALGDGTAVAVNRGWIPMSAATAEAAAYAPPPGAVTVTGVVARTQERESLGGTDPGEGRLSDLARVDVARLGRQVDERLYPAYVVLRGQDPAGGRLPLPVQPAPLDDGPHLNYAGQWFIFATLTVVVYPLLLRRTARHRAIAGVAGGPAPASGDGPSGDEPVRGDPSGPTGVAAPAPPAGPMAPAPPAEVK